MWTPEPAQPSLSQRLTEVCVKMQWWRKAYIQSSASVCAHDPDVVSFEWLLLIIMFKGVLSVAQLSQRFEALHRWANTHLWPSQTHLRSRNMLVTHTQQPPRSAEQWKKMLSDWHCFGEMTLLLHMLQNSFYAENASLWLETWSLHNKKTPTVVTQTGSVTAFSSQHLKTDHFTCAHSCCICFSFVDIS